MKTHIWASPNTRWWGYMAKKTCSWIYTYGESNVTNKNAIYQGRREKDTHLEDEGICWPPWLGVRRRWNWKESPKSHRNRDKECVSGVLGIEDQIGGKGRTGDKEAKDAVSGCNGARTSATQQWEQMTDFKPCSDWKFFKKIIWWW